MFGRYYNSIRLFKSKDLIVVMAEGMEEFLTRSTKSGCVATTFSIASGASKGAAIAFTNGLLALYAFDRTSGCLRVTLHLVELA